MNLGRKGPRIRGATWRKHVCGAVVVLGALSIPASIHVTAASDVIANATFTDGLAHWSTTAVSAGQFATEGYPRIGVGALHSKTGAWSWMAKCDRSQGTRPFLYLDVPGGATGYVQQQIDVPRKPSKLTFLTWGNLQPTEVTVSIVAANRVVHVLRYSPPPLQGENAQGCSGKRPVTKAIRVRAFAGQKVGLRIEATSQGVTGTIADFDDFSLSATT